MPFEAAMPPLHLFLFLVINLSDISNSAAAKPLHCYECSTEDSGDDCKNRTILEEQKEYWKKCEDNQTFCMVASHTMPEQRIKGIPNIWSMRRSCATECKPKCKQPPSPLKILSCTFCCRHDFCNGDDRPDLKVLATTTPLACVTTMPETTTVSHAYTNSCQVLAMFILLTALLHLI